MARRLAATLCLFTLIACAPAVSVPPDTLRMNLGAEPATLNPLLATDAYAGEINQYVFDSLIQTNFDTLKYEPKIADRWEISPDHRTYTFHLRKGVTWHDGTPFTADDVVFSFKLLKDPNINAPFIQSYYEDIEKVEKLDADTVRFVYSKVYFRGLSMCGSMPLLPKHILDGADLEHAAFSRAPVGMGPYRFKSWGTGKKIVLERFENYWDKKPEIKTIEYLLIQDSSMALQALKKGLLDLYQMRSIEWVRQTDSTKFKESFYKISYPGQSFSYVGWNERSAFFSDKRVRKAMTMLFDLEKIRDKIQFGMAAIVTGPFFPYGKQANPNIKPIPHDPQAARKLFSEAGWRDSDGDGWLDKDGKKFNFEYMYPSESKFSERLGTLLKEACKKSGIDVKITKIEWAVFLDRMRKRSFDATSLAWNMPFESDPYQIWHSSQADKENSSNYISYKNPEIDKLIEAAKTEFDETKRNALYWRFQEILYADQPYTFLFSSPNLIAVSKRFGNVTVHPAGLNPLEWTVRRDVDSQEKGAALR